MHMNDYARWYNGGHKRINSSRLTICLKASSTNNWELDGAWGSSNFTVDVLTTDEGITHHKHDVVPLTVAFPINALNSHLISITTLPWQLRFPEPSSRPLGQEQENEPAELWHEWEQPPLEIEHSSISERHQTIQSEHLPPRLLPMWPGFKSGLIKGIIILAEKWGETWTDNATAPPPQPLPLQNDNICLKKFILRQ